MYLDLIDCTLYLCSFFFGFSLFLFVVKLNENFKNGTEDRENVSVVDDFDGESMFIMDESCPICCCLFLFSLFGNIHIFLNVFLSICTNSKTGETLGSMFRSRQTEISLLNQLLKEETHTHATYKHTH